MHELTRILFWHPPHQAADELAAARVAAEAITYAALELFLTMVACSARRRVTFGWWVILLAGGPFALVLLGPSWVVVVPGHRLLTAVVIGMFAGLAARHAYLAFRGRTWWRYRRGPASAPSRQRDCR